MKENKIDSKEIPQEWKKWVNKRKYTEEEQNAVNTKEQENFKAELVLSYYFGAENADVIMENVIEAARRIKKHKPFSTFEDAWNNAPFEKTISIIFRAIHNLPSESRDTGQLVEFLEISSD